MGTCYSSKSADSNSYSTAPMASEIKSSKRSTPYCRSTSSFGVNANQSQNIASSHNFGFKRKTPIVIPSAASEKSTNFVKKYDKISLKDNRKISGNANTTSRFGFNTTNSGNKVSIDANSNVSQVLNTNESNDMENSNNNQKASQKSTALRSTGENDNVSHKKKTEMLKKQFLGSDFSAKNQTCSGETKHSTVTHKSKFTARSTSQTSLNESSANVKTNRPLSANLCNSGMVKSSNWQQTRTESSAKNISKNPTHSSGLPRPNGNKLEHQKKIRDNFITISYKAPSRLSSLNVNLNSNRKKDDNSVSVKKSVVNSEPMQTSMDRSEQNELVESLSKHSLNDLQSLEADSGFGSSLKSSLDTELQKSENGTLSEVDQIEPLSTPKSPSTPDVDGTRTYKTNISITLSTPYTSVKCDDDDDDDEHIKSSSDDYDSVICESSKSGDSKAMKNSLNSERSGTFSPTSELESRSDFLIDDEIADQPSLMVLNETGKNKLMTQSNVEPSYALKQEIGSESKDDTFATDVNKASMNVRRSLSLRNSDKKSPCHPTTLAVLAAHRQSLCSTLSSCSSINSDDLMTDYDIDRFKDFDEEESAKLTKTRHIRQGSTSSTLDELAQLVDSQKESSMVRQKLANIRQRSRTVSTPEMTQSLTEMPRNRSLSTPLKPPRPIRILSEGDSQQGAAKLDPSSYRSLCQDVTNVKTMLFRLKRLLHDADTLNPFETNNWKNSVYKRVANFEAPNSLSTCQEEDIDQNNANEKLSEENTDLRRQIVFLEQQSADKDRTIMLLQQQMTKYTDSNQDKEKKESCNAATQTIKIKSTTSMDAISPTTVSNSNLKVCEELLLQPNATCKSANRKEGAKPMTRDLPTSKSCSNLPKRSISSNNIPRAPSSGSVSNVSSSKTSIGSVSSQPDMNSKSNVGDSAIYSSKRYTQAKARFRSGAFSNTKLSSASNNAISDDCRNVTQNNIKHGSSKTKRFDKESKDCEEDQINVNDGKLGFNRNAFTRNSGRFLSLFKLKRNQSSNA